MAAEVSRGSHPTSGGGSGLVARGVGGYPYGGCRPRPRPPGTYTRWLGEIAAPSRSCWMECVEPAPSHVSGDTLRACPICGVPVTAGVVSAEGRVRDLVRLRRDRTDQ